MREALEDGRGLVRELFATPEAASRHGDLLVGGVEVHVVSSEVMASLAQTVSPQGIVAVATMCHVPLESAVSNGARLVAVLASVRDPGNAGTLLRSADAAGADAVVLTDRSVDVYNAKCVRASAGSLFHLPIAVGVPVTDAVAACRSAGLTVLAADAAGSDDLDRLADDGALGRPTGWLFGNEAWGLPDEVAGLADRVVRVPIHGRAESLNLAAAAAVCLYSSARAQRSGAR